MVQFTCYVYLCLVRLPALVDNLSKEGTFGGNSCIVAFSRNHKVDVVIHQHNAPALHVSHTSLYCSCFVFFFFLKKSTTELYFSTAGVKKRRKKRVIWIFWLTRKSSSLFAECSMLSLRVSLNAPSFC